MKRRLFWLGGALGLAVSLGSPATAAPAPPQMCAQLAPLMRAHKDGLSRADFLSWRATQFDRLDWQKRGSLSAATAPPFANRQRVNDMLVAFDANGDAKVTREEFIHGPTPVFDAADGNRDGAITQAEFAALCPKG
jgi:hypothetical protein